MYSQGYASLWTMNVLSIHQSLFAFTLKKKTITINLSFIFVVISEYIFQMKLSKKVHLLSKY